QRYGAVDDGSARFRKLGVGREVAEAFELPGNAGLHAGSRLEPGLHGLYRIGVEAGNEILVAAVGVRVGEQTVVEADFGGHGVPGADPGDVALDLDAVGAGRSAFRFGQVFRMDFGDVAGVVFHEAGAAHHVGVFQAHEV